MPPVSRTRTVIRHLYFETSMWLSIGERLAKNTSEEDFTTSAKAWLGDKTELRGSTINGADWAEVYETFKDGDSK